jgi:superfamily II DNA or RNA helicase
MKNNGFIYLTDEKNDGISLTYNGLPKIGVGRTNDLNRRKKEHNTGSKNTTTVDFIYTLNCDELNMSDKYVEDTIHHNLKYLGFFIVYRLLETEDKSGKKSKTEVFSGTSKKTIEGIISEGDSISVDLIKLLIKNITNVDIFKHSLDLLPHQKNALDFIKYRYSIGVKEVLLAHKPRSGKTFTTYGYLISEQPKNVLLLTQYPALNKQWSDDLLNLRGHDYNIVFGDDINISKIRNNFVMISLQDAKGDDITDDEIVNGLKKQKFNELKNIKWDLIIFDEIHKGKETIKTDKLLNGLQYDRLLGLSATPTKNIIRGSFTDENVHRYTLKDEDDNKKLYPNLYKNPKISYNLFNIDEQTKKEIKFFDQEDGFTFHKFSRVEDGKLVHYNDHITLFRYIFGKGSFIKSSPSFKLVNKCNSILIFVDNNECQPILKDLLTNIVGETYDIHYTNSDVNDSNSLVRKIKDEYIPKDGKKSIIIANKQLTTGLTLEKCDMVIFMNDWKSVDEYIQASYRCQSPSYGKDMCYVLDFNPGRAFNILYEYIERNCNNRDRDINKLILEYLSCTPIFESFGNELKKVDFEYFKNKVSELSGVNKNFFPKTVINDLDNIIKESELISLLGELKNKENHISIKLDNDGIDLGKNIKNEKNNKQIKDNIDTDLIRLLNNVDFLRQRMMVLCLTTEFKYDTIESIFEKLDSDENLRNEFLNNLMVENLLN